MAGRVLCAHAGDQPVLSLLLVWCVKDAGVKAQAGTDETAERADTPVLCGSGSQLCEVSQGDPWYPEPLADVGTVAEDRRIPGLCWRRAPDAECARNDVLYGQPHAQHDPEWQIKAVGSGEVPVQSDGRPSWFPVGDGHDDNICQSAG